MGKPKQKASTVESSVLASVLDVLRSAYDMTDTIDSGPSNIDDVIKDVKERLKDFRDNIALRYVKGHLSLVEFKLACQILARIHQSLLRGKKGMKDLDLQKKAAIWQQNFGEPD
jgi:hypothetical protein